MRPGSMIHSILGPVMRRVACEQAPICAGPCARGASCGVGRLLEAQPRDAGTPRVGRDDAPVRLVVQAPWDWPTNDEPLTVRLTLLSPAARDIEQLTLALRSGLFESSIGRHGVRTESRRDAEPLPPIASASTGARYGARVRLPSPLKLRLRGRLLDRIDIGVLLRRSAWRVTKWAYELQSLPWSDLRPEIEAEIPRSGLVRDDTRLVDHRRWSVRQRRAVPLRGLVGEFTVAGIGPASLTLLRLIERCGVGGGTTEGLGQIEISEVVPEDAVETG